MFGNIGKSSMAGELTAPSCEQPAIFLGNLWLSFETGQCLESLVKWALFAALSGFQSGFLPRRYTVQNKLPAWSMAMYACWYSDNATLFNGLGRTPFAKIEGCMSLHFCRPPCQCGLLKLSWKPNGMVRFGTDSVQAKGKSLNKPPPPPQALSLPLKRILSLSDICPKQFWDFPENFRKFFKTFRTFSVTSSVHYL